MDDWKLTAAARPVVKLERQSDMFVKLVSCFIYFYKRADDWTLCNVITAMTAR